MPEPTSRNKRKAAVAAACAAAAVIAVIAIAIALPQAPNPGDSTGAGHGGSSADSASAETRGVIELEDGTKVATYADEDEFGEGELEEEYDADVASFEEDLLDDAELEDVDPIHDPEGADSDGLGESFYKPHRAATAEETAQLVERLEGWWRPFVSSSQNASVRIHDGVCEEYDGNGALVDEICAIGEASVLRFDEGVKNEPALLNDGPGFFVEGLYTTDGKSDDLAIDSAPYIMQGAFVYDDVPAGESERLQEFQFAEMSIGQSGYLYRIDAPDWAKEAGLADADDEGAEASSSNSAAAGSSASASSASASSADAKAAQEAIDSGKQVFTGTVVVTTKGQRRSELGLKSRSDDDATLAYLAFDEPREYIESTAGANLAIPDCTSLGFANPDDWSDYIGKRIIVSAGSSDFGITDDSVERLYDFSGTFELVKVCEDDIRNANAFRAVGAIKL